MDRMIILMVAAGKNSMYGYEYIPFRAVCAREPRDAMGIETPSPMKLRKDSTKIASGIFKVATTII